MLRIKPIHLLIALIWVLWLMIETILNHQNSIRFLKREISDIEDRVFDLEDCDCKKTDNGSTKETDTEHEAG